MMAAFAYNRVPQAAGEVPERTSMPSGTYILVFATALLMGLRYEVGGDWFPYLQNYNMVQLLNYGQALDTFDSGYVTLVFVAGRLNAGIWLVNLVCGLIMTFGIVRFCSRQPNPALSFLVAIPYLIIVVGMGYTRQGVAIGLILAGLVHADGRSTRKLIFYVLAAALFHRASLLVLPIVLAPLFRRNLLYAIGAALAFVILFALLLARSADTYITNYVDAEYESGGAVVRVAMNLLPALFALIWRKRLGFGSYQSEVWTVFALIALATFPLVLAASFTTAIDRFALFLIPLQIAVLPRIPYIFGKQKALNAQLVLAVCAYSAAVQLVWLVFATHAKYWVPYKSIIFGAQ
ncbi:EpsG family protein [Novosphingopyxis sp. YJ-S2-01]|uniref:EpsG family protein n=1 Tax=Novosphingopyxis sp. YJ-S2-01 TaxID=2794021 RepID=UPI0018DC3345|nr:EpsG family protein [Novosphingopyxis sp. YJ-S2-01]MBH9538460.1 EpsG family protein [Novosphingopyxis sp. YJ-S2-01]